MTSGLPVCACHRAEHISLVEQLQGTHGVKGLDGLRSMGHMAPSLFTVDTNLFVKQIGSVAHWPTRQRASSGTVVIFDLRGILLQKLRGHGGDFEEVVVNPAMTETLKKLNAEDVAWGVWTCGLDQQISLNVLGDTQSESAGLPMLPAPATNAKFFLGAEHCEEAFGEASDGRTLRTKPIAAAVAELGIPAERLLLIEDEDDKCRFHDEDACLIVPQFRPTSPAAHTKMVATDVFSAIMGIVKADSRSAGMDAYRKEVRHEAVVAEYATFNDRPPYVYSQDKLEWFAEENPGTALEFDVAANQNRDRVLSAIAAGLQVSKLKTACETTTTATVKRLYGDAGWSRPGEVLACSTAPPTIQWPAGRWRTAYSCSRPFVGQGLQLQSLQVPYIIDHGLQLQSLYWPWLTAAVPILGRKPAAAVN